MADPLLPEDVHPSYTMKTTSVSGLSQRRPRCVMLCIAIAGLVAIALVVFAPVHHDSSPRSSPPPEGDSSLFLVETLPLHNCSLTPITGSKQTHTVFVDLANRAYESLSISVMYWNLLASEDDDTPTSLAEKMGSQYGEEVYDAIEAAAARGVQVRILNDNTTDSLGHIHELLELKRKYPHQVSIGWWDADAWYGGGIMHMKLWVVDQRHTYIGSANMDWLSLAQVKEMGVVSYNSSSTVSGVASELFEEWWSFAAIDAATHTTENDCKQYALHLKTPCWEQSLGKAECSIPFSPRQMVNWELPLEFSAFAFVDDDGLVDDDQPLDDDDDQASIAGNAAVELSGNFFISASPVALIGECFSHPPWDGLEYGRVWGCQRTWDLDGLVNTITDAKKFVYLSVMDFLPSNPVYYPLNGSCSSPALWWNSLVDPLISMASSGGVEVRLLISWWAHSDRNMIEYLYNIQQSANTALSLTAGGCGNFTISMLEIPGWNETAGSDQKFPPYSRVNHAKYIVTDRRVNIGTSNMQWSYYFQAFLRDWESDYSVPLSEFMASPAYLAPVNR